MLKFSSEYWEWVDDSIEGTFNQMKNVYKGKRTNSLDISKKMLQNMSTLFSINQDGIFIACVNFNLKKRKRMKKNVAASMSMSMWLLSPVSLLFVKLNNFQNYYFVSVGISFWKEKNIPPNDIFRHLVTWPHLLCIFIIFICFGAHTHTHSVIEREKKHSSLELFVCLRVFRVIFIASKLSKYFVEYFGYVWSHPSSATVSHTQTHTCPWILAREPLFMRMNTANEVSASAQTATIQTQTKPNVSVCGAMHSVSRSDIVNKNQEKG